MYNALYYRSQRSCGQGNIFTPVCHSVHRGGLPQCMLGYTPPEQTPPQTRPPGSRHPPGSRPPWADTPPPRSRHPSPREADSSIRSTSGRYASYWNAFLSFLFRVTWRTSKVCLSTTHQRYSVSMTMRTLRLHRTRRLTCSGVYYCFSRSRHLAEEWREKR